MSVKSESEVRDISWRERIIGTMLDADRKSVIDLQKLISVSVGAQRWYYAGAGLDVFPIILSPAGTEHFWIDPVYNSSAGIFQTYGLKAREGETRSEGLGRELIAPLAFFGAKSTLAQPWNEALLANRQTITIDDGTKIEMFGSISSELETVPANIDVIYCVYSTYFPHPAVLASLKVNGSVLYCQSIWANGPIYNSHGEEIIDSFKKSYGLSLQDLGFKKAPSITLGFDHLSAEGQFVRPSAARETRFHVYWKTRDLKPDEQNKINTFYERDEAKRFKRRSEDPRSKEWARRWSH